MSINQEDMTEKAEQIGEMHRVYREATRGVAYLGHVGSYFECVARVFQWAEGVRYPGKSDNRRWTQLELVEQLRGFDVSPSNLRAIFDKMNIDLESHVQFLSDEYLVDGITKDEVLGFEVAASMMQRSHPFHHKMLEILEHEWFSRLWTYQEYHLAVRVGSEITLEILLGDYAVPWTTFMDLHKEVLEPGVPYDHQTTTSLLTRSHKNLLRQVVELPGRGHDGAASLWSLLETSCRRRATVAADHVFAVVGS